jgi:hypothetical protein
MTETLSQRGRQAGKRGKKRGKERERAKNFDGDKFRETDKLARDQIG